MSASCGVKSLFRSVFGKRKRDEVEAAIVMEMHDRVKQGYHTDNRFQLLPPDRFLTAAREGRLMRIRDLSGEQICNCIAIANLEKLGTGSILPPRRNSHVSPKSSVASAFKVAQDFPHAEYATEISTYPLTDIEHLLEPGSENNEEEGWYLVLSHEYPRIYQHPRHRYLFVVTNEPYKNIRPTGSEVTYLLSTAVTLLRTPDEWSSHGLPRVTLFTMYGTTARVTHLFFHQKQAYILYSPYFEVDNMLGSGQLFDAAAKQEQYSLFMSKNVNSSCRCGGITAYTSYVDATNEQLELASALSHALRRQGF